MMELIIPDKQFVCIDYPAIVQNEAAMLETMGGEKAISKTFSDPVKRLELRFRPKDIYCKGACADRQPCTSLLIRVQRKPPTRLASPSVANEDEVDGEIVGIVDTMYTFQSLADFQYLTMTKSNSGAYESLNSVVHIDRLQPSSWLNQPAPLHILPPIFSRYDHPTNYGFREPPKPREGNVHPSSLYDANFIGASRQKRPHFTRFFTFTDVEVPTEPHAQVVTKLAAKLVPADVIDNIKQLFARQPVWSRNALHAHISHVTPDELKVILPAFAYYCLNGPWRTMWVRFGYDMRKDPSSKIYQNLDYRLPRVPDGKAAVPAKRSSYNYNLPNTVVKGSQAVVSLIQQETFSTSTYQPSTTDLAQKHAQESRYKFRPGMKPAYRQMFYQLCYIEEPQVQRLIHINDGQESQCSETDGWCLPGTIEQCRKILMNHRLDLVNDVSSFVQGQNTAVGNPGVDVSVSSSSIKATQDQKQNQEQSRIKEYVENEGSNLDRWYGVGEGGAVGEERMGRSTEGGEEEEMGEEEEEMEEEEDDFDNETEIIDMLHQPPL